MMMIIAVVILVQKFISSSFSHPFNTVQGPLDVAMTGQTLDVLDSQSNVNPMWIALPLCGAIIVVLFFAVVIIMIRSVTSLRH